MNITNIKVNGQALTLLSFRSFLFKNEKYTIFLEIGSTDNSQAILLKHLNENNYTPPAVSELDELLPHVARIIDNIDSFSYESNPNFVLLPWEE